MLRIQSFTFNPFQENTYLLINENRQCWIVDPGMYDNSETDALNDFIAENTLMPQSVINTHTHLDHIFGVHELKTRYNIPFFIHEKDMPVLSGAAASAMMFGIGFRETPQPDGFISEKEMLVLGEDELEVRFTPGHSPGSVVFYSAQGKWVIGGDVLFRQSIGRSDLPGGNHQVLIDSIRNELFTLPDDTVVLPGHGPSTTIGFEKIHNPFLQ